MKTEQQVAKFLQTKLQKPPKVALILGSGWNKIINKFQTEQQFDFKNVFGQKAGVKGHLGKIVISKIKKESVLFMAGRFHTYEGYSSYQTTLPIRAFAKLKIKNLIISSAAGGLNKTYRVGDIVILSDILNLFVQSPLQGAKFQDLSTPFEIIFQKKAVEICQAENIPFQKGVYIYMKGPHYESFADKRALRNLGADVVGMSTCPEVIMANHLGLKTLGLSCVTNLAFVKHSHQDVITAAKKSSKNMILLLKKLLSFLIKN